MANYIDGFVIPIKKKDLAAYRRIAAKAGKVWMEHGALEYFETVGDELTIKGVASFEKKLRLKPGETALFSWIVYKSKAHRNAVNKKVMTDPRIANFDPKSMPVDMKQMWYGGFKAIVAHPHRGILPRLR